MKEKVPYYACNACGFTFSKPAENANFPDSLESYEVSYIDYFENSPADLKNHQNLLNWMEKITPTQSKTVLDIGAGSGKWVRFLNTQNIQASGLEPAQYLYDYFLKEDKDYFTHATTTEFLEKHPGQTFDIITCFDVLEHIGDPQNFLKDIETLLKPGGYLFLSLPDAGSFLPKTIGKHWHHYNKYHMSFFSHERLSALCRSLGFEEKCFARRGRVQSAGYIVRYFFDFVLGRQTGHGFSALNTLYIPVNFFDTMYIGFQKTG